MHSFPRRVAGFTLVEILTVLVVVAVLAALAIPAWHTHLLRMQRADAREALIAVQSAQDKFFGAHARYAAGAEVSAPSPGGLALTVNSAHGFYHIEVQTSADGLGYAASARSVASGRQMEDARCAQFTLDQNGRRRAVDSGGADRSADCWH